MRAAQTEKPASQGDQSQTSVLAEVHKNAVEFVELSGSRQRLIDSADGSVKQGQDAIRRHSPNVNPAYVEEWGKRMRARFNADDYVSVFVHVYENHFNQAELQELIQAQRDLNNHKTPNTSEALKAKLAKEGIGIQSEILGGCAQVGARNGGEVDMEILKEHPEWITPDAQPQSAPKN
jgi:hypothetical protein